MSHFFIDRPIFATVLSVVISLAGLLALKSLPVTQYPDIAPPSVQVAVSYPGASAQVVADTIAAPIEQQVNGIENMLYMSSQSNNDGTYNLLVTFELGTDLNTALVMVQNRVTLALPQLPTNVQQQGITVRKRGQAILLIINFHSPDRRYDDIYLSNYVTINCRDELLRLPGIGDITYLGQRDYSLRYWLDPQELSARNIAAGEVVLAIKNQNLAAASGQYGSPPPSSAGQATQVTYDSLGRLENSRTIRQCDRQGHQSRSRRRGDRDGANARRGPGRNRRARTTPSPAISMARRASVWPCFNCRAPTHSTWPRA